MDAEPAMSGRYNSARLSSHGHGHGHGYSHHDRHDRYDHPDKRTSKLSTHSSRHAHDGKDASALRDRERSKDRDAGSPTTSTGSRRGWRGW